MLRVLALGLLLAGTCVRLPGQLSDTASPPVDIVNHHTLAAVRKHYKGKIILVNVWASWCLPCKTELPALLRLREGYRKKGVEVLLVSADDPDSVEQLVRPALRRLGVDFLTFINRDSSDEAFINGLNSGWSGALPATFLFDRKGAFADMMVGERTYEQFEAALRRVLRR